MDASVIKLVHVLSMGFYGGALAAMLSLQFGVERSEGLERTERIRLLLIGARRVVNPLVLVGFLSGLAYLFVMFGQTGNVMRAAPPYVHLMLVTGFVATGLTHMWSGKLRRALMARDEAQSLLLRKGRVFALAALMLTVGTFCAAILRVPGRSVPPQPSVSAPVP